MRRAVLIVLGLGIAGCNADVVLGRNFPADDGGSSDAGADGGTGRVDGGSGDGGLDGGADAGADAGTDAGVADGGLDGGADAGVDGGVLDGGADAGASDAGADAGSDAGVDGGVDGGLRLDLTGPLVVQSGDLGTYVATVTNGGGVDSIPLNVVITFPAGVTYSSSATCAILGATQMACDVGIVQRQTATSANTTMTVMSADAGLGWYDVTAAADVLDASVPLSVTGVGSVVLPIVGPRFMDVQACFGSNLYSYAQCTPPSLVTGRILLLADGGVDGLDAGFFGLWGQSPHQRNVGFRFIAPGNIRGTSFSGVAVNATCFQGVVDNPAGTHNSGAFQGCLN